MTVSGPMTYTLRVDGHLDDHWSDRLGDLAIERGDDGTTTLRGPVEDQARLHGVLAALRDIGAALLDVHAESPAAEVPPALGRTLRTERLTLRPPVPEDAARTWSYRRAESVDDWLTWQVGDVESYCEIFAVPERFAATVIVQLGHEPQGEVIGDFVLRRGDAWAQTEVADRAAGVQAELGWVIDPAYGGQGYATEAVRELIRYCFEDLGVRRVIAECFLDNRASWRLMERVGMRREAHTVRDALHRTRGWCDSLSYALLAEEWRPEDGARPATP